MHAIKRRQRELARAAPEARQARKRMSDTDAALFAAEVVQADTEAKLDQAIQANAEDTEARKQADALTAGLLHC